MVRVTAILVDDGEANLERCVASLRNQKNVSVEIILCGGPKTNYEFAKKLAEKVLGPIQGIGKARVEGILQAGSDYILSCDSDSIYDSRYSEYVVQNLREASAVRAGTILSLEPQSGLGAVETLGSWWPLIPYEFALAFRRGAFLQAGIHKLDYDYERADIGGEVFWKLWPRWEPRMIVHTKFPSYGAKVTAEYLPSALAGLAPVAGVVGLVGASLVVAQS